MHLAQTASEGIEKLKDMYFDLILLDYMLPDMNGIEAFKKIKEMSLATPVILITGYGTKEMAIEALKLDAFDFIEKPLYSQTLRGSIHRCLEMQRLRQEREQGRKEHTKFLSVVPILGAFHRLSNYLAIISGNLQLLERSCPATDKHEFIAPMKKALQECQRLMEQTRHASKIEKELELLDINHSFRK